MERAEAKDNWFVQVRVLSFDFKRLAINSLVKNTHYTSEFEAVHYAKRLVVDLIDCCHACCWSIYRRLIAYIALDDTFAIMNLHIKTGPATDLLLELSIMQSCHQKDQILLPCFLHEKFSIYLYHFPWRRAGSLSNIVDRQRCVRRGQRPLLRLLHPGYSNRLWVWPINCMLHGNPIDAVGSSAS